VSQSLDRALSLLTTLGRHPDGATLSQLATESGLPASTVHRLLAGLRRRSFVTQASRSHLYFVGPAISQLWDSLHNASSDRVTIAPREMIVARDRTGESVFLSELRSGEAICQHLVPSQRPLRIYAHRGQRMPLNAAASARVLLAWRDETEVVDLLQRTELAAFTTSTPRTVASVLERLEQIRERGYDTCTSELDEHIWAVAYPVRQATGEVTASLTLAAPDQRMSDRASRREATLAIHDAALALSLRQGWSGASGSH